MVTNSTARVGRRPLAEVTARSQLGHDVTRTYEGAGVRPGVPGMRRSVGDAKEQRIHAGCSR